MALRDTVTPARGHKENEDESNLKKPKQTNPSAHFALPYAPVTGVHREPDISLLWSLTTTNQSLLAMEQLSALHSIGEEGTSNPCSSVSVSPKITTNASVVKRLYVKLRGTGIYFLHNKLRSHYNAAPRTKPRIAGVALHLLPLQSVDFCHYINLFQSRLCRLEFA